MPLSQHVFSHAQLTAYFPAVQTGAESDTLALRACECAMDLQDTLHDAPMAPHVRMNIKVGVGLGSATMFYVGGDGGRSEYFAAGPALKVRAPCAVHMEL